MTTAQYVAVIDRLRARAFPVRPGWSDTGRGGPGYHLAALVTCDALLSGEDDAAPEGADQLAAECEALVGLLGTRWGEAQTFSLWSMLVRYRGGEEIPPPWDELCTTMSSLCLWRADGRWIGVGAVPGGAPQGAAAGADPGQESQLVAVVTDVDPP
ncbi:hypothetical protein [Streptomyces sp. NBC_00388]|uniref:hypothetical protein n=1 Tax=Streptomyces sp. NBC_00388 TaxID=2975735 RepID=UPI002E1C0413